VRYLNLIFQGGGVKGIAYAGVLQSLPSECEIRGVGGTSAGALVAALVAIGKRGNKLQDVLKDPKLFKLLEKAEAERFERLKSLFSKTRLEQYRKAAEELNLIWNDYEAPGILGWKRLRLPGRILQFKRNYRELLSEIPKLWQDLSECWAKKGFHSSLPLRKWLDEVLEDKKFQDVTDKGIDLRIVAADVTRRSYVVFDGHGQQGESIARAVHASVSIPIFFEPLLSGTECFVDGGMLSNFPHFLFAQSPYPTVGFELVENTPKLDTTSTVGFLGGLLGTMVAAHDKHRKRPPHFRAYSVETPRYIPFDKFDLTDQDVNELYYRGVGTGQKIKWTDKNHSSEEELVVYYDPRPDDVLHQALKQADALIDHHIGPQNWVDEIRQTTVLGVRIEEDWSSRYDRRDEIKVAGPKALFLQRVIVKVPKEVGRLQSLADTDPRCVEDLGGKQIPLVHLPAFNREDAKGFVVFYSPPISASQGMPRKVQTSMGIRGEFASVAHGSKGDVSLLMTRRAAKHLIRISIEVWVHRSLPSLEYEANFSGSTDNSSVQKFSGRSYEVHSWSLPEMSYENIPFPLAVTFKMAASEKDD
jgi:predicted acylesterase/phospholipase RssA